MDVKRTYERKPIRRGTPQQIAQVAQELSRLARREVNINFVRSLFDSAIENQLLQKILSGNIRDINIRDLRHPRLTYEDRLEGIDRAGILKQLLPKTTRQLIDEIDDVKDITDENLILYKNDLKRRIEEKVYESKEEYNELVETYDRLRQDLDDNELTGYFRFRAEGVGGFEKLVPAKPEQYEIYPELNEGNVDIPLLTEEEEKIIEDENLDYLNKFEYENLERTREADYEIRIGNFMEDTLADTIQNLGTTMDYRNQPLIRDIGIKLVGTFLMNKISHYIPYIDMFNFFKRNKLTTAGVATAGYLGKLFYDYYTSQPGSKISPDLSQERGHVFSEEHNYNGPGTKVEERFELDNRKQGKFPYIFPSNVLDLIALEHDILYTSPNQNIQQLADLRYVENVRNPKQFLLGLNKRIGKELINPKDIDDIVKEFYANNLNLLSTGFIQSQAISRSIKNPLKLVNFYKDIRNPEMIIELFKPDQLNRRYGIDIQELYEKPPPEEYIKYLDDVDKSVNSVLTMMADIGQINNKGDYVLNKKIENKEQFEKDLQTLHNNFNELVLEQRKVDNEDIDNINRYRQVKLEKEKINQFINNINKVVDDPEHIKTIKEKLIKKENNNDLYNIEQAEEMVVQHSSVYEAIDEVSGQERHKEMVNIYNDAQRVLNQQGQGKTIKAPKSLTDKDKLTPKQFQAQYKSVQKKLQNAGVEQEEIDKIDDIADQRQGDHIESIFSKMDQATQEKVIQATKKEFSQDLWSEFSKGIKEPEQEVEVKVSPETTPADFYKNVIEPVEKKKAFYKDVIEPVEKRRVRGIAQPFTTKQVLPQKPVPPEGEARFGTGNKDNPDNLVDSIRATDKNVKEAIEPTPKELRQRRAGLIGFITPSDNNGGIGTRETNPLIRGNYQRWNNARRGGLKDYYINHELGNNNNLYNLKEYDIKEIDERTRRAREAPRKRRGLIRRFQGQGMPDQIQTQEEKNHFINIVNPPSNYYKGSIYKPFFVNRTNAPMPYSEYLKMFYSNNNEFYNGADNYKY